jgi:hypothetical protein
MMSHAARLHDDCAGFPLFEQGDRSLLRSFRRGISPDWFAAWIWKTNFAVARPVMLMLITGEFLSAGSSVAICDLTTAGVD